MRLRGLRCVLLSFLALGAAQAATQSSTNSPGGAKPGDSVVAADASRWTGITPPRAAKPGDPSDELFSSLIPRLVIRVEPSAMRSLDADLHADRRTYVHATVTEGDRVYTNVAIHLKGGRGSPRPVEDKPGFTLNFDHFQPGQLFHGLDKVHLNNSVQDSSMMNEVVGSALNLAAGVPTPRATHARVRLNNRDLGVYVLLEGFNKRFLKRYFEKAGGNLYESGTTQDIMGPITRSSGSGPDDRSDLRKLVAAATQSDPARRLDLLPAILDVDRFITFAAMERILCHWDGYTGNRNNYRLYFDPSSARFVFFPHGMDQLFADPHFPLMPGVPSAVLSERDRKPRGGPGGILNRSTSDIPALLARYGQRVGVLLDDVFTPARINGILGGIENRIHSQLDASDPTQAAVMLRGITDIRTRLLARVLGAREEYHRLAQELNLPPRAAPGGSATPLLSR